MAVVVKASHAPLDRAAPEPADLAHQPLTDPQDAYLTAEAARLGITIAGLIRRIIDDYRTTKHPEGNTTNGTPEARDD